MSFCAHAISAATNAVAAPTYATNSPTSGTNAHTGDVRATRYTPAVTIVAAWISADTGVGPAMASGSHTYSGICALLPAAPTNSSRQIATAVAEPTPRIASAWLRTPV